MFSKKLPATFIPANGESHQSILSIAAIVCDWLGWEIVYASQTGIIAHTPKTAFSYGHEITLRLEGDGLSIVCSSKQSSLFDIGKTKKHLNSFISTFEEHSTTPEDTKRARYEELRSMFEKNADQDLLAPGNFEAFSKEAGALSYFKPRKGYIATPVIAILNIFVFIVMTASGVDLLNPDPMDIHVWGGNYGPDTLNGQWWRIFSCGFIHIGVVHLLMNLYGLLLAGSLLETIIGTSRFIAVYILTLICSSILSMYWHPGLISAGASGAIMGLFGVLLSLLTTNILPKPVRMVFLPNLAIFVVMTLANGMKEGIDNAGHIGGLTGGIVIGYAIYPSLRPKASSVLRALTMGGTAVLVGSFAIWGFLYTGAPQRVVFSHLRLNEIVENYNRRLNKFVELESMALEPVRQSEQIGGFTEQIVDDITNRGIYYWDECIKLLDSNSLSMLPGDMKRRNDLLLNYCYTRKKQFYLVDRYVRENSEQYLPALKTLQAECDSIIIELAGQ